MADDDSKNGKKDEPLGEGGMRALEAERDNVRTLKRENTELATKLDKLEQAVAKAERSKLSKEEQQTARITELENENTALKKSKELDTIRREVAKTAEVPEELLTGEDRATLEASAAKLKEWHGDSTAQRKPDPNPYLGDNNSGDHGGDEASALSVLGFGGE